MSSLFYTAGQRAARSAVGLYKVASSPEMGEALYAPLSSATGDEGVSHGRSHDNPADNARTSFLEHDRHVRRDPHNEAHPFPVGAQQSRLEKAGFDLEKLKASTTVPIVEDANASWAGGGAYVADPEKIIYSGMLDPHHLAHEIGHSEVHKTQLGRLAQSDLARALFPISQLAGLATSAVVPGKWKIPAAIGVSTLLGAPTLYSEGAATYEGYKRLKELGASDRELNSYLKNMALPFGSYLAGTTLAPAGLAALGAYVQKLPKVASNMYESDIQRPVSSDPGPTHNQVPGDFLGLPQGAVTGQTHIVGGMQTDPKLKIDRQFRQNDEYTDTRVMEGTDSGIQPSGPEL